MSTKEAENVAPVKEEPDTDDEAPRKARWDMTTEEKLAAAKGKQERGNACFKKKDIDRAVRRYIAAIDYISFDYDFSSTDARRAKERRLPCHTNLAMCYIKQEKYYEAKRECDKALEIDENSVKALFRRGVALSRTGAYSKAKKDFNAVLKIEPKDKKTLKEIAKLDALKERKKKRERKFSQRMMKNISGTFAENRAIYNSNKSLLNTVINNGIFSIQSFDKILDIVANYWENCYMVISILCCSGHALGIFGNESYVSSTFLAIGLLAGGSTHLNLLNSFEKLLPSWMPQKHVVGQIFAGIELFLGMALLTSVKLVDRGIIGRIITSLSVLLAVPMTVQVRTLNFKKIMEDPHIVYYLRRYALTVLFGIWGLGVSGN